MPNSDGWNRKKPRSIHRLEPRATVPARKTTHEQEQGARVDVPVEAAVEIGVDGDRDDEADHADRDEHELPVEVVRRVAGHVVARDPGDHPEAEDDDPGHGQQHQPVEAREERRGLGELSPPRTCAGSGAGAVDEIGHQSE